LLDKEFGEGYGSSCLSNLESLFNSYILAMKESSRTIEESGLELQGLDP
jgi:hypothetical protein